MTGLASLFLGKQAETQSPTEQESQPYGVLFVDDEEGVLSSMKRVFRKENYRLYSAESGEKALAVLSEQKIHVIVSDHRMPGMTGAELLRKVKDTYPEIIRIMLTGYADVTAITGAINEGAVYKFITKPWNDEDLRITIGLALEKYDLIKENKALKDQQQVQEKKINKLSSFIHSHRSQVGRVTVKTSSKMVDMRLSTLPTINGEKIVLRLLDRNASIKGIDELSMSDDTIRKVTGLMDQPQGCILTTGPTGSGKTSTLYSLLQQSASITKNITTIEDHASLTGHTVLSTLHTNGTIATITRLKDMGIKSYVLSEALTGIIAQRLVRRLCPACKTVSQVSEELQKALCIKSVDGVDTVYESSGCDNCHQTGFQGRIGLFEVLIITDEIRTKIHEGVLEVELKQAAKKSGMKTLLEDGIDKLKKGETTAGELLRVLGPQNINTVLCPHCQHALASSFSWCPFCSKPLQLKCSGYKNLLDDSWSVCPFCGFQSN